MPSSLHQASGVNASTSAWVSEAGELQVPAERDKNLFAQGLLAWTDSNASDPQAMFPLCPLLKESHRMGLFCLVGCASISYFVLNPPDFEQVATEHLMPHEDRPPLVDLRGRLPNIIPADILEQERPTYAWAFRLVFNVYAFVYKWADANYGPNHDPDKPVVTPIMPFGWR